MAAAGGGSERHVDRSMLLFYALPAVALAMPTIPVYVYLPTFYAETLGLGLAATGLVLLAARILDVVTDPLIGIASDRLRLPGGRRKPWIVIGAVLAAVALVQMFEPPETVTVGYLAVWAAALYLGWTLVAIPYTAWGAQLTGDYHGRARIAGAREAAMILGIVVAAGVPAAALALGAAEGEELAAVAWLAIAIGGPALALLLWRVPEPPREAAPVAATPRLRALASMYHNKPFVRLVSAWFINGLANGLPAVLFPLYLDHVLQASPLARNLLILAYFVAGIAAIPMWLGLSRRFGKHRTWCGAMVMACAAFVWVPFLAAGDIAAFSVVCIVTGMALGADLALPPAMQADVVDLDTLRTGRERAGLFFAIWSMATKLALGAAVGLAFPALQALGFRAGVDNPESALLALALIYALLPTMLKLAAVAVVWRHPITARRHGIIRRRLDGRRERRGAVGQSH
ncbi:MAG: MFS transporter [Rhodospirillales bacterium]|nr:MFS transporter [Rhodospirillales bacterium]